MLHLNAGRQKEFRSHVYDELCSRGLSSLRGVALCEEGEELKMSGSLDGVRMTESVREECRGVEEYF